MTSCKECVLKSKCEKEAIDLGNQVAERVGCSKGKTTDDLKVIHEKLAILNQLEVIDHDRDSDGIIYIHIDDSADNVKVLEELGATSEDFETMRYEMEDSKALDITEFAFCKLKAGCWSSSEGFKIYSPED